MYKWKSYNHLSRHRMEEIYLNMIKFAHDKSISNTILNEEKLKLPLKSGTRWWCPLPSLFLFIIVLEVLIRPTRLGKERLAGGKEEVKSCLFADGMILHLKDPKDSTTTKPEQNNKRKSLVIISAFRETQFTFRCVGEVFGFAKCVWCVMTWVWCLTPM